MDSKEEEQGCFKNCCGCDDLRAKVGKLDKIVLMKDIIGGKSLVVLNLEEMIAKYEREICENANNVVEIMEPRDSKARLSSTFAEFGRSFAIKSGLQDKISSGIDSLNQEKLALMIQVEEYEKEIEVLKEKISGPSRIEDRHGNRVEVYSQSSKW